MPYIIQKRSDIPAGLLQTLGLTPNESQRNQTLQPVGQTGYTRALPNPTPVVTGGVFAAEATGLTAWLMANVSSGAGTPADAAITTVAFADLVNGDNFTINDGQQAVNFVFVKDAVYAVPTSSVAISVVGDVSADDVRDTVIAAINASVLDVTAADGGAATVDLVNNNQNQTTANQNNTGNAEAVANVGFAVTDFANATDSDSLTTAEASQNATDILDLLDAGDALTHTAINGALTTGALTKAQVADLIKVLAGFEYVVPAGADVEVAAAFVPGAGDFNDDSLPNPRHVYDTEALRMSFHEGRLALACSASFTYGGVSGAALVVYNDDGSLYTG